MCHQSVGLAARAIEAAGFTTVTMTSALSITERVMPPRSLLVDAPLGHTAGPKHEDTIGRGLVEMALGLPWLGLPSGTITDSGYRWPNDGWRADPLGWSRKREDRGFASDPSAVVGPDVADTRTARSEEPQYQSDADRAAAIDQGPGRLG